ncbi:MAG: DNA helicase UvrD, partial [Candidatus Omnitrophica bacterium]|nr:DNA helicase UvrD [Candidatus Omnitrophota bacterium]
FFPEEGKYHFDGHRNCKICFSPAQTKRHDNICPVCTKPLTVGVLNRVDALADRPEGVVPDNAIPFKNCVPLDEIIAEARGVGKASKAVEKEYFQAIGHFGTEFNILLKASADELKKGLSWKTAEGVISVRSGRVGVIPGYDGEYGKVRIFSGEGETAGRERQLQLF